jgi:hypothetical protein
MEGGERSTKGPQISYPFQFACNTLGEQSTCMRSVNWGNGPHTGVNWLLNAKICLIHRYIPKSTICLIIRYGGSNLHARTDGPPDIYPVSSDTRLGKRRSAPAPPLGSQRREEREVVFFFQKKIERGGVRGRKVALHLHEPTGTCMDSDVRH